ncbi:MAG: hypothetical protein KC493_09055 [Bacteriovoracaceae bacterium]|nr:hypothetical protein [Bacteriovoracaceae bacterium]
MKLDKNQTIIFFLLSLMFFLLKLPLMGLVLGGVGTYKYVQYKKHPLRPLLGQIEKDSTRFGAQIPLRMKIQEKLMDFYRSMHLMTRNHPQTLLEVERVKEDFWRRMSLTYSEREWNRSLDEALNVFKGQLDHNKNWSKSLKELDVTVQCLEEAQREVAS